LTDVGGRDSITPLERPASYNNVFDFGLAKQVFEAIKDRRENSDAK
jgi:hypothetical protein